jgi:predicted TPR repeat methyltransferase
MSGPETPSRYPWKAIPASSHLVLLERASAAGEGIALLDLGCGSGEFGRLIRSRCRRLCGIEADPVDAARALDVFDDLFVGDLVDGLSKQWGDPFDVIVAGDILEHLSRPEVALSSIRPLLAPGGRILVSVPNVANISVRLALLAGRFEMTDRGILDRTHLRFFTRQTARELLTSAGFAIEREWATPIPAELAVQALSRPPLLRPGRALSSALARSVPTLFGYQFVFEARVN